MSAPALSWSPTALEPCASSRGVAPCTRDGYLRYPRRIKKKRRAAPLLDNNYNRARKYNYAPVAANLGFNRNHEYDAQVKQNTVQLPVLGNYMVRGSSKKEHTGLQYEITGILTKLKAGEVPAANPRGYARPHGKNPLHLSYII